MTIKFATNASKGSTFNTIFVSHVVLSAHAKTPINTAMNAEHSRLIGNLIFNFRHIGIGIGVDFAIHQYQIALLVIVLITVLHALMGFIQLHKECVLMKPAPQIVRSAKTKKHVKFVKSAMQLESEIYAIFKIVRIIALSVFHVQNAKTVLILSMK